MAPKGKSSASSATRKKHARKAAVAHGELLEPQIPKEKKPKGEKKGKNKEPRKKIYIPPVKPAPVQPDPLNTLGIAQRIPADLLVVLRLLAKKDSVTKRRALEDLQSNWVEDARKKKDAEHLAALAEVLPVWLHHVPTLFLHPSRRIRLLAVGLHVSLLKLPSPIPDQLFFFLHEVADPDQAEYIIGSWCMVTHDVDRQVSSFARESWDRFVSIRASDNTGLKLRLSPGSSAFNSLWDFTQRVILDPASVYTYVNPPQPAVSTPSKQTSRGASARTRREDEPSSRSGREDEEESDGDRKARLRIGGFGVAEWVLYTFAQNTEDTKMAEEFIAPLDNLALWSSLYYGQSAPFVQDEMEAFGYGQPGVRKAAWSLVQVLLRSYKASLTTLLSTLSIALLRSAWVESDAGVRSVLWQPLLTFLKEHPNAWEIEVASNAEADIEDDSSEEEEVPKTPKIKSSDSKILVSHAYEEFRQFLELGCMGSPVQGYPAVIIILSTIPSSILASVPTPVQALFTSFWAAIDGRALSGLDRTAASAAFLSSLLECIRFIAHRLIDNNGAILLGTDGTIGHRESAHQLVNEQVERAWEELCRKRLKVEDEVAADLLAGFLKELHAGNEDLFDTAWTALTSSIRVQVHTATLPVPALICITLKTCTKTFSDGSHPSEVAKSLTSEVLRTTISRFERILEADDSVTVDLTVLESLVAVLDSFGSDLFADPELASAIDDTCLRHVRRLLAVSPTALQVYLSFRGDEGPCTLLWAAVLREAARTPEDLTKVLPPLLDAAEAQKLPSYLRPTNGEMDDVSGQLVVSALNGRNSVTLALVSRILAVPEHFITQECVQGLVTSLSTTFSQHVQEVLRGEQLDSTSLTGLLSLLDVAFQKQSVASSEHLSLLPNVFTFAFVLPLVDTQAKLDPTQYQAAKKMWHLGLSQVDVDVGEDVTVQVKQLLRDVISDCSISVRPSRIIRILTDASLGLEINILEDLFPSHQDLDAALEQLPTYPNEPSLAVIDPLILPGDWGEAEDSISPEFDYAGYTAYSRNVNALLSYFLDERQAAKQNIWALRHFLALAIWAQDLLNVQGSQCPVFSQRISRTELEDIIIRAQQLSSYLLAPTSQEDWLQRVVRGLVQGKPQPSADGVEILLHTLVRPKSDSMRESRVLHAVLQHVLADASKTEADEFVQLARSLGKKAPHSSLAIAFSITRYAPEPPRLERYRNELAADIYGVPPSKANTDGLWLLRQLAATAPDPESDVVFLPVPRAVNLMKACQQWITSDEDLDEAVESELTAVFLHLAPILQNVPGSHWDLIFDVMENNLENCSFDETSSWPTLARTLKLLITVQDLVTTNKALRAIWEEKKMANLTLVRDMTATELKSTTGNVPLSVCRQLALTIVQDLPEALLDKDTLSKMCHVLTDPSDVVQRMAYKMLRESAAKYTEHLVLEAAVDSDTELKLELPLELVALLQSSLPDEEAEGSNAAQNTFGYLLTWMLTFDLFTNASLRVKSGYLDHLRRTNLIVDGFLPYIFNTLGLYDGIAKAVKLDIWAVDEYYLDLYAPDVPVSLPILAAHLYYRSLHLVPVLIRNWLLDCRDRQLSTAVTTYTSTYFSPALLQAELTQVKDPDAASQLTDENIKVKVANAINEITATYTVDDQELEIRLKLPPDWPLHTIEIKEGKRVGVSEDRWRAWILGVQQILTFRSGSITDGLVFFMKNVASHFEGQSECAICYSVISAMDGSLPKKPCRTCKNRFHAGCLYKWFSTSHSSSCPLCRSEII